MARRGVVLNSKEDYMDNFDKKAADNLYRLFESEGDRKARIWRICMWVCLIGVVSWSLLGLVDLSIPYQSLVSLIGVAVCAVLAAISACMSVLVR